jgi:hypothetical protein
MVGAKETMLILVVPNAILAAIETRAGRTGGARWWACVMAVVAAAAVAAPLAIHFSSVGVDYYGRSVSVTARLDILALGVRQLTTLHVAFLVALAVWVGTRIGGSLGVFSPGAAFRRLTFRLMLASAAALGMFLTQFVLYHGDITPGTHYEFPAALGGPALLVVATILLRSYLESVGRPRAARAVYRLTGGVLVGLALLSLGGFREQRAIASGWANATRDFTAALRQAAGTARADPDIPVVVTSGRPLDMEPILSVGRFLSAFGAANRRFLVLDWESGRAQWSALERHLAPMVEGASRNGGLGYEPIARLRPEAPCFSIGLRTAPHPVCRSLGRLL